MADEKFKRFARTLPSLYRPEANQMIRGLLKAWGLSDDDVVFQIRETKDQIYVKEADDRSLDSLGDNVGVPRESRLNLSDNDYRKLIPILSYAPKQVKSTIVSLLDVFWGPGFTRPNVTSNNAEPYSIASETPLSGQLEFKKGIKTVRGTGTSFTTEVQQGDYIKPNSFSGTTYAKVGEVIDDTTLELTANWDSDFAIGVSALKAPVTNLFYITDDGEEKLIRFKPYAFDDITSATAQEFVDYINDNVVYKQDLTASVFLDPQVGNKLNLRTNTAGLQGSIQITGGDANVTSKLDFPTNKQVELKCAVYEINPNEIVVRIPSSVPVLRRSLRGSAHLKSYKAELFSSSETFDFSSIGATSNLQVEVDGNSYTVNFNHSSDFEDPSKVLSHEVTRVINDQLSYLEAFSDCNPNSEGRVGLRTTFGAVEFKVSGGSANGVLNFDLSLQEDGDILKSDYPSAYLFDPTGQLFTVTRRRTFLSDKIDKGSVNTSILVDDASEFPNQPGNLIFNFGRSNQEGPIRYNSRPNNSSILIDGSHVFQEEHLVNSNVNFVDPNPTIPRITGEDYPVFVTGTEQAREGAQDLIRKIIASGVVIRFIVDFPEVLFECQTLSCCDDLDDPDHRGPLTDEEPLVFK